MSKKNKSSIFFLCLIFLAFAVFPVGSFARDATPPTGFKNIQDAPNINLVSSGGSTIEIPGEYSFEMNLINQTQYLQATSYEVAGNYSVETIGNSSKVYTFDNSSGKKEVLIKNGGIYQGRQINVKFVIDQLNMQNSQGLFRFFAIDPNDRDLATPYGVLSVTSTLETLFLMAGSGAAYYSQDKAGVMQTFTPDDTMKFHYEFYDRETNESLNVKGIWNFKNINKVKEISFPYNGIDYKSIFAMNNSLVDYKSDSGLLHFTSSTSNVAQTDTQVSTLLTGTTFPINYKVCPQSATSTKSTSAIMYSTQSIARIAPSTPIVIGEKNTATHEQATSGDLQYRVVFSTGDNLPINRTDAITLQTEVPEYYDIDVSKVKVTNSLTGVEYPKSSYTVKVDSSNKSKMTITFNEPKSDAFNGNTFLVNISAKQNSKFAFAPNKYGYLNADGAEDNGYLNIELAESTKIIYTHSNSNTVNKEITSVKDDNRSIAKVNYQGLPTANVKTGLTLDVGKEITAEYTSPADFLEDGYTTLINTNNLSKDTPIKAEYIGTLPNTSGMAVGSTVNIPIRLTSKQGVTKDVTAILTITTSEADLKVEFRNELDMLLSEVDIDTFSVGDTVNLLKIEEVTNELDKYTANGGYTITARPTEDFKLTAPSTTVVYKLKGNLYIASAPETFDFGQVEKKLKDIEVKQAKNLSEEQPLTIVDNRGDKSGGWNLTLKSIKEFTFEDQEITEAMVYRTSDKDGFIVSSDANSAYSSASGGNFVVNDIWRDDGPGLGIKIKVNDIKKTGAYKSEIEWELVAGTP